MRKKLLALLLAAALALSLLAGCGGGESVASALLKLLDGRYPNISIEIDPDLEADLRQAIRKAEAENAGDDAAVIRAALEKLVGSTITFRNLRNGQKGETAFDLVFYSGTDPDKAAQAAYSQWNPILSNVPDDGKYDTSLAMVETNSGVWMLVKATVEKAGSPDKPDRDDPEPVKTSITVANDMLGDLNSILKNTPSITEVDFSKVTKPIPEGVLRDTNVSKVIVETGTTVMDGAFAGTKDPLTIEVTTGSDTTVGSSILGGASDVTLDLSDSGITYIDMGAFYRCTKLESVDLSGCTSLERIDDSAFSNCSSLESVDLSGCTNLEYIYGFAFSDCSSLESVDLSGCTGLKRIWIEAFSDCSSLESIDLSGCTGLEYIDHGAFSNCSSLESVDLSGCTSLTSIKAYAFNGCTGLNQVTLPSHNGNFGIDIFAFAVDSGPQPQPLPLHLRIPNENTDLTVDHGAFSGRNVTVYYSGSNEITSSIENPGGGKVVDIKPYPSNP